MRRILYPQVIQGAQRRLSSTALLAPMPSASDTIAIAVTNGFFRIERNAYLKFIGRLQRCEVIETEIREKGYRP